ncbi:MAG: hypothetical protein KDD41_00820 [Flavobacteriales bacterium]|nr:hypothetical protein [Flavobacteriales bacterium]
MYKKITCFLVFVFLVSAFGFSQGKLKDGYQKFYYSNGQISSEGLIQNGMPEGYWISYYPNGIIKSEGNRKQSLLDSTWIFYSELGNLQSKINYRKGKKNGIKLTFSDSCNLVMEENFIDDVKDGSEVAYYDTPGEKKWKEIPFVENIKEGVGYEYAEEDGRLITIIHYKKGTLMGQEKINRMDRNGKKTATWKKFYEDGKLMEESRYKDGLLNGYLKEYDQKGTLINATLYVNGVAQTYAEEIAALDIRKEYYEDGTVRREGIYDVIGKENGVFKYFDPKGKIEKTEFYVHGVLVAVGLIDEAGKRQGYWEEYYLNPEGQLKSKGSYKDGEKIDEWEYYFADNQLQQIGKYNKNGKPHGLWKWYFESGKLLREENFRKGLEDGMLHEYLEDGSVITEGEFIDGKKEGMWLYQLGDHKEEGNYRDGVRHGVWTYHYTTTGELNFEGNFIDGQPDGKHKYYYENGKPKREEIYMFGTKSGTWKFYDTLGEVSLTIQYKDGKEYKLDSTKLTDK